MIKKLVFILCLGSFFVSCKKEYSYEGGPENYETNNNYIKFNVEGVGDKLFKIGAVAMRTTDGAGDITIDLLGYASTDVSNLEGIHLTIFYNTNITPSTGVYREDYQGNEYLIEGNYNPNSPTYVYTAGYGYTSSVQPLTITITSITATRIIGTFSGAFYKTDPVTLAFFPEYFTITGGQFNLPIQ